MPPRGIEPLFPP